MNRFRLTALLAVLYAGHAVAADDIPVVPASVLDTPTPASESGPGRLPFGGPPQGAGGGQSPKILRTAFKPLEIMVKPGINQVLPIAIGHYNRIVTPFESPFVQTVSEAVIEPHENVLYIASDEEYPVTLFITPDVDDESHAISLTLQPSAIPPVEATLKLEGAAGGTFYSKKKAQKFEEGQPYTESLKRILRDIALGNVPEGFAFGPMKAGDMLPACLQPGMSYEFLKGQYLRGHHFDVSVGTIRNTSAGMLEVDETACINGQIAAVAVWPEAYLPPGESSEIYVVMRRDLNPPAANVRRSLLRGQQP